MISASLAGSTGVIPSIVAGASTGSAGSTVSMDSGIGAVSAMNDGFPWGIWITYDVVVGTAFACGGYSMALLVYVFNNGEYHPLVRPALLASMFGYTLAGVSVFIDIGRYWQIYNVFLPWFTNFNSVLLEVALCIALYIGVLWVEFSPAFIEAKTGTKSKVNKVLIFFIALGVLLPTMHQSSLGSLMILAGAKLSQLWWTSSTRCRRKKASSSRISSPRLPCWCGPESLKPAGLWCFTPSTCLKPHRLPGTRGVWRPSYWILEFRRSARPSPPSALP